MNTSFIKPSSFTQQEAERLIFDKQKVLKLGKLSYEEHEDLMFEYGCRFIEYSIRDTEFAFQILTTEDIGFWAWWRIAWAKDDSGLIRSSSFSDGVSYPKMKSYLITNDLLRMDLKNLLMYG